MAAVWQEVRRQFPVLRRWVYLDSATFGPVPRCAYEAVERHARRRDERACLDFIRWFDDADRVRALAARLVGGAAREVAFAPSSGAVLGWLVQGLPWRKGDRVVALEDEFPSNTYTGHMLAARGVEFVQVPAPGGEFSLDRFLSSIHRRTRVVLMSMVNYSTGLRPPLEPIASFLRERGVLFYLDATQGLGPLRLDLDRLGVDVVAAHAYKWLLSPAGIAFACFSPQVREMLPPAHFSWRSHQDWRRVEDLHHGPPRLPADAQKFEGGLLNFSGVYALGAVLRLLRRLGTARIERRVGQLAAAGREVLRRAGGELLYDRFPYYDSPILAARFPGLDVTRLAARLRARKVVVSARHGYLRVSPHFFNSEEDLARLAEALARPASVHRS